MDPRTCSPGRFALSTLALVAGIPQRACSSRTGTTIRSMSTMADKYLTLPSVDLTSIRSSASARYRAKVQLIPEARQREADHVRADEQGAARGVPDAYLTALS